MRVWTQIHCWWSDILSWRKKSGHEEYVNAGKGTNMRTALGQTLCWTFCMLLLENVQEVFFFFFLVAGNKNSKQLILSKNKLLYYVSKYSNPRLRDSFMLGYNWCQWEFVSLNSAFLCVSFTFKKTLSMKKQRWLAIDWSSPGLHYSFARNFRKI